MAKKHKHPYKIKKHKILMTEYSVINTNTKEIMFVSRSEHLAKVELDMLTNRALVKAAKTSKAPCCKHHNYLVIKYQDTGPTWGCSICGYQYITNRYGLMEEVNII